ncbi:hypothetical protein TEA_026408 [Camellia sinensis var. sinensis]|uniref:Disease resistance protein At4g27190-like leucine-rich repeats domain-containing protein n=1 Tax=Camellia sinensis var. sinensis TaxID=542762 RepID=A0A4V3WLR6_CAMSN|nr:hypothetical protein TEA_026408 [Camellia sinensis var. sinensis]
MGKGSEDAVQELFRDREGVEGCQHLKELVIGDCATPECLVNTMECVPRTPNAIPSIFPILESLELCYLPNLRKICHCQLPTYSFGKLKRLAIYDCDRMEEVIWKEKGEDDSTNKMEFPALESMTLWGLPMLIGFCRGTDEIEFSQLKKLCLQKLPQLKWLFLNSSYPFSESMENHNTTFRSLFPHKKEKGEDDSTNKMEFPALESMTLWGLPMLIGFCRGTDEIEFSQLKKLCLQKLPQLKWLFLNSSYPFSESMENHNTTFRSLFPHKVALPSLEELELNDLDNLEGLEHIPISVGSFSKLRRVHVEHCGKLLYVFPSQFLTRLQNLEDLTVENCSLLEVFELEMVDYEKGQGKSSVDKIEFTQLKVLRLYDLQNLVSIFPKVTTTVATSFEHIQNPRQSLFNEKVAFPSLEKLVLRGFQNMNEIWCNELQTGSFNKLIKLDHMLTIAVPSSSKGNTVQEEEDITTKTEQEMAEEQSSFSIPDAKDGGQTEVNNTGSPNEVEKHTREGDLMGGFKSDQAFRQIQKIYMSHINQISITFTYQGYSLDRYKRCLNLTGLFTIS